MSMAAQNSETSLNKQLTFLPNAYLESQFVYKPFNSIAFATRKKKKKMELSPMRNMAKHTPERPKTKRVWKLKLNVTWQRMKKALKSGVRNRLHIHLASNISKLSTLKINHHDLAIIRPIRHVMKKKNTIRTTMPLQQLIQMPYTARDFVDRGDEMTPTKSPIENISTQWRELHGLHNWDGLIEPLHPWLRREVVKYGEFVEATYDAFDFDQLSEFCGSCRYNRHKLFEELGLTKHGYNVTKYIYAMSHVDVPEWFEKSYCTWSKDSNWMGYVAVSGDVETARIGRRDILVAWRGTVAPTEWYSDLRSSLQRLGKTNIKVQSGFLSVYCSKGDLTRYNKSSASEQVMEEIRKLVHFFRDREEEVSLTICGHSLGGALALLNAYDAATYFPDLFISVISFAAPRVGNIHFKEKLNELGVKTLRVVIKQDIVPKLPGFILNTILNKFTSLTGRLKWMYRHVGTQLKLDMLQSPYLRRDPDYTGCHNLEIYLHLLDGYVSRTSKFRWNARRDVALVNKSTDMLIKDLKIPVCWYERPFKGLVLNQYGRWVKPGRQAEHIPSPHGFGSSHENPPF